MSERSWQDERGRGWVLCDNCNAPVEDGTQFWTNSHTDSEFSNLEYCAGCARNLILEWSVRLPNHAPQGCWCGGGPDCDGIA